MVQAILQCQCGAKLRLPGENPPRQVRCPKCKTVLTAPAAASAPAASASAVEPAIVARAVDSNGSALICPICQSPVSAAEAVQTCPGCHQVHHQECWEEIGGCSSYGCAHVPAAEKTAAADQPLTAWGDDKNCPVCGERIKSIALKCRYCDTTFDTVDPLSMRDLHRKERKALEQRQLGNIVVVLFAASLVALCAAPILVPINLIYILPRREKLAAAGPFYLILGYSAIGLPILYSILMLLFYLIGGTG